MLELTPDHYLAELVDIREKLKDFTQHISDGQTTYYKDISVKLRILYCAKSGTKPLLITIQNLFGFDIFVYILFSLQEQVERGLIPDSLAKGLEFHQINSVAIWFERGNSLTSVFGALNRDEVFLGKEKYTYMQIIEVAADKMGAHVDSKISTKDANLHLDSLLIGGLPVAQRALFDTAKATIFLIDMIEDNIKNKTDYRHIRQRRKL